MQNTLLIQAIPYEDESPISFLLRTAKLNAHSSIFNLVGKVNYQSIIKESLNYHLVDDVRFSLVLNALNINSDYSYLAFERSGPTNRSPRIIGAIEVDHELLVLDNIRYCPICLAENAYLKKLWMLKPIYACPTHSCFLIDSCPNCDNPITLKASVKNCSCCGYELDKVPTREATSLETIYWFIDVLNNNSNKLFKEFTACWKAFNEFFEFDEMCRVKIPLPPIEIQRAIVNIYKCANEAKQIAEEADQLSREVCPALLQHVIHS